jgi:hypothetical protein
MLRESKGKGAFKGKVKTLGILTVNVLVNVLDALDAASGLDIEMALVLAQEERVVGNDPAAVNVVISLLVAYDARKDMPMFWSLILGVAVDLDLGLFAEWERELLGALSAALGHRHARAIGIESAAGPVNHVDSNESVKLWIDGLIWNLTRHYFIHSFGRLRFVGSMFQDQEDMYMRQPPLLNKKKRLVSVGSGKERGRGGRGTLSECRMAGAQRMMAGDPFSE